MNEDFFNEYEYYNKYFSIEQINKIKIPMIELSEGYPSYLDIYHDMKFGDSGIFTITDNILNIYFNITKRLGQIPNIDFKFVPKDATWECFYNIPGDTFYASISIRKGKDNRGSNTLTQNHTQPHYHIILVDVSSTEHKMGNHTNFFKLFRNSIIGKPSGIQRLEHPWYNQVPVEPIHIDEKYKIEEETQEDLLDQWSKLINLSHIQDPIEDLLNESDWNKYRNLFDSSNKSECIMDCLAKLEVCNKPKDSLIVVSILSNLISIPECRKKIFGKDDKDFKYNLNILKSLAKPRDYDWINISRKCVKIIKELIEYQPCLFYVNLNNHL